MTASAMTQDIELTQKSGMNGHVAKPIDVKQLLSMLVKWIAPKARDQRSEVGDQKAEDKEEEAEGTSQPPAQRGLRPGGKAETAKKLAILPDALAGINIEKGLKTVIGNEKLYRKLLGQFHESSGNAVSEIKNTLEAGDTETAARLAHTVKGVAGNLGAEELFSAAADLEKAIKQEEIDGLDGLIDSFEAQLDIVMGGIQELEDQDASAKQDEAPLGEVTIDVDAVKPLLIEMAELLESDLMEAMNRLETIEQHLRNSEVLVEFSQLSKHIDGFDTDKAMRSLKVIAAKLDISLDP